MPLFEYLCPRCQALFEVLLRGDQTVACPECESRDVTRQVSSFAVSSAQTRHQNVMSARKERTPRARDEAIAEYDRRYNHDH